MYQSQGRYHIFIERVSNGVEVYLHQVLDGRHVQRVVHQRVRPAELRHGGVREPFPGVGIGDVGRHRQRAPGRVRRPPWRPLPAATRCARRAPRRRPPQRWPAPATGPRPTRLPAQRRPCRASSIIAKHPSSLSEHAQGACCSAGPRYVPPTRQAQSAGRRAGIR